MFNGCLMDINGYLMDMNGYEWMVFHPNHGSFTMVLTVLTPIPMFFFNVPANIHQNGDAAFLRRW